MAQCGSEGFRADRPALRSERRMRLFGDPERLVAGYTGERLLRPRQGGPRGRPKGDSGAWGRSHGWVPNWTLKPWKKRDFCAEILACKPHGDGGECRRGGS